MMKPKTFWWVDMLSKENSDKLISHAVYSIIEKPADAKTWCRNWTFVVEKYDGRYFMVDTYWGSSGESFRIELTDDNISNFKLEMIYDDVKPVDRNIYYEYAEDARFNLATDSGGWQYSKYYVLKNRKPSREKKREILKGEILSLESSLEYKQKVLFQLDSDDFYE